MEVIKKEFEALVGESFDHMMLLDLPGEFGYARVYNSSHHKYALYNDPFFGFLDPVLQDHAKDSYRLLAKQLEALSKKGGSYAYLYEYMASLCRALIVKYDLGLRTREAYDKKDPELLAALPQDYEAAAEAVERFAEAMRTMWYKENKPHGFEVHEQRLGGLIFRLRSLKKRLEDYVKGAVDALPELEEGLLPLWVNARLHTKDSLLPDYNDWRNTVTVNRM